MAWSEATKELMVLWSYITQCGIQPGTNFNSYFHMSPLAYVVFAIQKNNLAKQWVPRTDVLFPSYFPRFLVYATTLICSSLIKVHHLLSCSLYGFLNI